MEEARFAFGKNWRRFLEGTDERHTGEASVALKKLLGNVNGKTFLDIGSGSGIHSLAAVRAGASRVVSFDYDADSVECTQELRRREGDVPWEVLRGSVLDETFLRSLGPFDIVYSWGVLHHTGAVWDAVRAAAGRVAPRGTFAIGIYNRKALISDAMTRIKRAYVEGGPAAKKLILSAYWLGTSAVAILRGRNPLSEATDYHTKRGMNYWRDLEDWVGGYPFECATPAEVIAFVLPLGFSLQKLVARTSIAGVSEYVFQRNPTVAN